MSLAVVLSVGVALVLAAYAVVTVLAVKRSQDVMVLAILGLTAYWTLAGALPILQAKDAAPGSPYSYLEDRLFPVYVDSAYAATLLAYSIFALIVSLVVLMLVRPQEPNRRLWAPVALRFSHSTLLLIVLAITVARLLAVLMLLRSTGSETSLYAATRTVQGGSSGLLRAYQYLNITGSYSLACGLALWLGFPSARRALAAPARRLAWIVYAGLAAQTLVENALLGNRAVPLVVMAAVAVGWLKWRFLAVSPRLRWGLSLRFMVLAAVGLFGIGAIGAARGGSGSSAEAVFSRLLAGFMQAGQVFEQIAGSSEKTASHMSLYGVLRLERLPVADSVGTDSYKRYATLVGAPADQVFTIHHVASWWLDAGVLAPLLAGLTIALVLVALQWLSIPTPSSLRSAIAIPAGLLPAAGLPVSMLRSGPESLRGVVTEMVLLPGAVCAVALLKQRAVAPTPPVTTTRRTDVSELQRMGGALRRRWWMIVAAALVGGVLALLFAPRTPAVTYEVAVPITKTDVNSSLGLPAEARLSVDWITRIVTSPETKARIAGTASVSVSPATDSATLLVRTTASTDDAARDTAAAYATEITRLQRDRLEQGLGAALRAHEAAAAVLASSPAPRTEAALAEQAYIARSVTSINEALAMLPPRFDPVRVSASGGTLTPVALVALAMAALAAAAIGFAGVFDRKLRYPEDLDRVLGPEVALARLDAPRGEWATRELLRRHAAEGGLAIIPIGAPAPDELLPIAASVAGGVRVTPPLAEHDEDLGDAPARAVLAVRWGRDDSAQLTQARATLAAAGVPCVGVIAG